MSDHDHRDHGRDHSHGRDRGHDREDRIYLHGLTTECIIGFIDWERRMPQTLVIDLELPCDCSHAAASDHVDDTVDYKQVAKRVLAWVGASQFQLLETLAHRLALLLLAEFPLAWVRIRVSKPGAIRHSRDVGVSIERTRAQLDAAVQAEAAAAVAAAGTTPQAAMNTAATSTVFVAIGSNVDPGTHLPQAARALKQHFPGVRFSACYRNSAFGFEGADFLNAVAGFDTALPIGQLLATLRGIETQCGRGSADPKWGPRAIDLDLLLYDQVVEQGVGYTVPRPDLTRRAYMLGPLAELAPQWRYPPAGPTIAELWERFPRGEHALHRDALDLNAV